MVIGLFISLWAAFLLFTVPWGEYDVSPASMAVDAVRRQLHLRISAGRKGAMMETIGRNMQEVVKTGALAGGGMALVLFLLSFRFLGPFSVGLAVLGMLLGVLLTDKVAQNEYARWQGRLLDGLPTLVNIMPAFLEVDGVTPREAIGHSLPFLPEPLRSEMNKVMDKIRRTGRVREAMDALAERARHPLIDAVGFRLSAAWDARVTSDIFADLGDQIENMGELAVARATAAKTGYLALVSVLGLIGMTLIYGYPGLMYLLSKIGSFGA